MSDLYEAKTQFDSMKEYVERQTIHLDSKVEQYVAYEDNQMKMFRTDLMLRMEHLETRIRDNIMFEISGQMEQRAAMHEKHQAKLSEILIQLNNNNVGESLVKRTHVKEKISVSEISSIYQSLTSFDVIV